MKFPGPTRHFRQIDPLPTLSACPLRSDRVRTFAPQRIVAKVESRMGAVAWAMRQLQTKTVFATMAWQKCANAGLICRTALSAGRCQRRGLPGIGPAGKTAARTPPAGADSFAGRGMGAAGVPPAAPWALPACNTRPLGCNNPHATALGGRWRLIAFSTRPRSWRGSKAGPMRQHGVRLLPAHVAGQGPPQ